MNPTIIELLAAAAIGLAAGLIALLRRRAVARGVLPFLAPATPWQKQLAAWNREDAEKRRAREAQTAHRADTLRSIYLADLAGAESEEVAAR